MRIFLVGSLTFLLFSCVKPTARQTNLAISTSSQTNSITLNQKMEGYHGIWYYIGDTKNEYVYKYSGGLGTYPANHQQFAVYAKKVNKTFFCYGGATKENSHKLLHMVSYYDHKTGLVPKPTLLLDKQTDDAHDNPVMNIDDKGYIWIFSTSHGRERPSYIHKSRQPYDISAFDKVEPTKIQNGQVVPMNNFSYVQSWYQPGKGFLNLFTSYEQGLKNSRKNQRITFYMTSKDGISYSAWNKIGAIEEGHYQTSGQYKNKVGTAFNMHPLTQGANGLDYRTNIYYLESADFGKTWKTVNGNQAVLPITERANPALVHDYKAEGLNVYINDVNFDENGRPVIVYVTSKGPDPGPQSGPFTWRVAFWNGNGWEISTVTTSDSNYDMGSIYTEADGTWRIIGPTETGPQAYNTGGEMAMWESKNGGKTWTKTKQLTRNSPYNHSYARRPVNAHPDFYAFWADGHGRQPSESRLYFSNKAGQVFRLPTDMKQEMEKPMLVE